MSKPLAVHPVPFRDPISAFAPFEDFPYAVLLDSASSDDPRSRWSVIADRPSALVELWGRHLTVDGRPVSGDLPTLLGRLLAPWTVPAADVPPGPLPGLIGFLGYEAGGLFERLPAPHPPDLGFPDGLFGWYDAIAVFDRLERRAWTVALDADRAAALAAGLGTGDPPPVPDLAGRWRPDGAAAAYPRGVRQVLQYILAGDIYQANLTWRFLGDRPAGLSAFDLHRRLRSLSPAPFAALLGCGPGRWLVSASPERFLSVDAAGRVETRPIKGTRPRGASPAEDRALARALADSAKDRAENLMIVDLLRNDLSRRCRIGSVRVPQLCAVETFSAVHHLVSVVEGRLTAGATALDLLGAAFPGGSVTGAPKIRAMEIIHELEPCRRGPYCGTVLHLGVAGAMDSSIVIRTLMVAGDRVAAHAGCGIVADSVPEEEYAEMMLKARPLLAALDGKARR